MRKVLMRSFGPPDVLELVEASIPRPKPHEVLVRTTSIGMNRADVDCRQGIYPIKTPPAMWNRQGSQRHRHTSGREFDL